MTVQTAVVVPTAPAIIPGLSSINTSDMDYLRRSYLQAAQLVLEGKPDAIVICSSHATQYGDYFHISPGSGAAGDFSAFGKPEISATCAYDQELAAEISRLAAEQHLPAGSEGEQDAALDQGCIVPLYFLQQAAAELGQELPPLVRIGLSYLPLAEHYHLGQIVAQAAEKLGRSIAFIASGDLAHKLKEQGPFGYDHRAVAYDDAVTGAIRNGNFEDLFAFDDQLRAAVGERGHRCIVMLTGCLDCYAVEPNHLAYYDAMGVGYCVCTFVPGEADAERCFRTDYLEYMKQKVQKLVEKDDAWLALARRALQEHVAGGKKISAGADLPAAMTSEQHGVFVSLYVDGQLRGFSGSTEAKCANVAEEIISGVIEAAAVAAESSCGPLRADELDYLLISLDVVQKIEQVTSTEQLNPKACGLIVSSGDKRGLMLPDTEGVYLPELQLMLAKHQAGIAEGEPFTMQRFTASRHFINLK